MKMAGCELASSLTYRTLFLEQPNEEPASPRNEPNLAAQSLAERSQPPPDPTLVMIPGPRRASPIGPTPPRNEPNLASRVCSPNEANRSGRTRPGPLVLPLRRFDSPEGLLRKDRFPGPGQVGYFAEYFGCRSSDWFREIAARLRGADCSPLAFKSPAMGCPPDRSGTRPREQIRRNWRH